MSEECIPLAIHGTTITKNYGRMRDHSGAIRGTAVYFLMLGGQNGNPGFGEQEERRTMSRRNLVICILTWTLGLMGYSQENPKIKRVSPSNTDPTSGVEMYRRYCAVCHGLDGKGNGPAARALKQQPSDLTLLSKRNGGEFPTFRMSNIIQGDARIEAHGSSDMPMWGNVFRVLSRDEALVKLRVRNLTRYLASLQQK